MCFRDLANYRSSTSPLSEDLLFSMGTGDSGWGSYQTASLSYIPFPYNGIAGRQYDATADGQYFYLSWVLPESLFEDKTLYTAVFDVINDSETPKKVYLTLGNNKNEFHISRGLHMISTPYFWTTGDDTVVQFEVYNLITGDSIQLGRGRLFKGNCAVNTVNTIVYGTVSSLVPNSSYIKFYQGDQIINMDASAGEYIGRQCITSGSPGAWKPFGAIEP